MIMIMRVLPAPAENVHQLAREPAPADWADAAQVTTMRTARTAIVRTEALIDTVLTFAVGDRSLDM